MSAQPDIVYLSRVPWDSLYQRPQHLAAGLAQRGRVLFVDTPRSTFHRRFVRPLLARRPVRPFLWQAAPGLHVLSPGFVPFPPRWWPPPGQYALSRLFVRWAMRRLGMSSAVLWAQDPRDLYFLDAVAPRLICYDCMDDYALIAPSPAVRPRLRALELDMLRKADLVFASSRDLAQRCAETNAHTRLVANGVDSEFFAPANAPAPPADLAAIARPRLGYTGSLAPWVDLDLLAAVAEARPQWSIVLVGPVRSGFEAKLAQLQRHANVHVLGERPYTTMPAYVHSFDVCVIPFCLNDLTRAVNPVKFFEYMAAGKPVVATPLPELLAYDDAADLATDAAGFVAAIDAALAEGERPARVSRRLAIAAANSWQERVDSVARALLAALQTR